MKFAIVIASAALALSGAASAAPISGLCNTGQDELCGGLNTTGGAELHWYRPEQSTFVPSNPHPAWLGDDAASRWITPDADGQASFDPTADGTYLYGYTFNIAGGLNPATASFSGRFAVDNAVDEIRLNGNLISGSGGTFNAWTAFSATSGFLSGANTLEFRVRNFAQNGGNPTGLRVEFLESAISAVPEPASWALMIVGFGALGGAMRRRRSVGALAHT